MNKLLCISLTVALAMSILSGCATTSIMGSGFEKSENDRYVLKVGTGGTIVDQAIAAEDAARSRLEEEARKFLTQNPNYNGYEIIKTERSVFPLSYYQFTIEFK